MARDWDRACSALGLTEPIPDSPKQLCLEGKQIPRWAGVGAECPAHGAKPAVVTFGIPQKASEAKQPLCPASADPKGNQSHAGAQQSTRLKMRPMGGVPLLPKEASEAGGRRLPILILSDKAISDLSEGAQASRLSF